MKMISLATITRTIIPLGVVALAGCHQMGQGQGHGRGPTALGGGATAAVSRAQEADMQIALGRAAERRGDLDQALAAYQDAARRDKHRADAYQRMAIIHDRKGDFRQSAEFYRIALASAPGDPDIYCDAGYSLYLQRRWAEAERNLKQAIVLRPDHARAHNNLGMVLARDHRAEEAVAEYRKAGNSESEARTNLAVALTLDGRWDEALDQYKQVLALDPSSTVARDRIREMGVTMAKFTPRDAGRRDDGVITTSGTRPARAQAQAPPPGP